MAKVARLQSLLPRSRIFREEDPWALVRFMKCGPRKQPRNEAEWAHHFLKKSSRLVLTLDMSSEATDFRNQLKAKYLHPWGGFPDTRFELIDPLPDRHFYVKMYKDTINDFCARGPPEFPVGPTLNFFVSEQSRLSGLVEHVYPKESIQGKRVVSKEPTEGHFLIVASFPRGSVVHLLRDYFIKELGKFPNEEVQRVMKNVGKEKFRVQMPLGYCTHMGKLRAEETKDEVAREFVGTEGLHLGTAVSLSLWRKHYDEDPEDKWGDPVLVDQECVYSKALEEISKKPSSSFVSIAPEKQFMKETQKAAIVPKV
ncbi:uncharacterized protein EAF02_005666 [Botrytis sinoallii]|uniref:uncharacterized protein n=1 Tax=Botrytis sinoallii TaxID=1463999 RepID=UPI0018FF4867|nr:uncharacterized protein EAF02_005666 [Botrytis sinoallii]KAF7883746.1 hypothetical protein EAF02_005666 [Botrytis sinoallii]